MGTRDPRVDAYIAKAAPFARPILAELRERVHATCRDCEEAIKWGAPHFLYQGRILCGMAAFKAHAAFNFWQGNALGLDDARSGEAMGQLGRLAGPADLPGKRAMAGWLRQAMALRTAEPAAPKPAKARKPPAAVPADLAKALARNARAGAVFDGFPESGRRDYVEWIESAKREDTRQRRLDQAVEWLAEGKRRHWKYEAC